jgi:hypothetical protein
MIDDELIPYEDDLEEWDKEIFPDPEDGDPYYDAEDWEPERED